MTANPIIFGSRSQVRDWSHNWMASEVSRPTALRAREGSDLAQSGFGQWLASGGDRRSNPRPLQPKWG